MVTRPNWSSIVWWIIKWLIYVYSAVLSKLLNTIRQKKHQLLGEKIHCLKNYTLSRYLVGWDLIMENKSCKERDSSRLAAEEAMKSSVNSQLLTLTLKFSNSFLTLTPVTLLLSQILITSFSISPLPSPYTDIWKVLVTLLIFTGILSLTLSSSESMTPSTCEILCFILTCWPRPFEVLFVYSHSSYSKLGEHPASGSSKSVVTELVTETEAATEDTGAVLLAWAN